MGPNYLRMKFKALRWQQKQDEEERKAKVAKITERKASR